VENNIEKPQLQIVNMELGPAATITYIVGHPVEKKALVIDPAWDGDRIAKQAEERADTHKCTQSGKGRFQSRYLAGLHPLHGKPDIIREFIQPFDILMLARLLPGTCRHGFQLSVFLHTASENPAVWIVFEQRSEITPFPDALLEAVSGKEVITPSPDAAELEEFLEEDSP